MRRNVTKRTGPVVVSASVGTTVSKERARKLIEAGYTIDSDGKWFTWEGHYLIAVDPNDSSRRWKADSWDFRGWQRAGRPFTVVAKPQTRLVTSSVIAEAEIGTGALVIDADGVNWTGDASENYTAYLLRSEDHQSDLIPVVGAFQSPEWMRSRAPWRSVRAPQQDLGPYPRLFTKDNVRAMMENRCDWIFQELKTGRLFHWDERYTAVEASTPPNASDRYQGVVWVSGNGFDQLHWLESEGPFMRWEHPTLQPAFDEPHVPVNIGELEAGARSLDEIVGKL